MAIALVPELGWPMAVALGAIVSPPDAIAATSIARRLNLPRRLVIIFEGESLVNDATALTVYRLAVIAAVGTAAGAGTLDLGEAAVSFVVIAIGGAVFGLVIGWGAAKLVGLLDDPPVEILVSLLTPFAAYIPAERLGVLGRAGGRHGRAARRLSGAAHPAVESARLRRIGVADADLRRERAGVPARRPAAPDRAGELEGYSAGQLIGLAAAICLTVIAVRLVWVYPATYLPRWLVPGLARRDPAPPPARRAHPRLGRHARGAHAGRRPGPAAGDRDRRAAAGARPRDLPRVLGDPRDAHRPRVDAWGR